MKPTYRYSWKESKPIPINKPAHKQNNKIRRKALEDMNNSVMGKVIEGIRTSCFLPTNISPYKVPNKEPKLKLENILCPSPATKVGSSGLCGVLTNG